MNDVSSAGCMIVSLSTAILSCSLPGVAAGPCTGAAGGEGMSKSSFPISISIAMGL